MDEKKESSEERGGFKVTDRRAFTMEGTERAESQPEEAAPQESSRSPETPEPAAPEQEQPLESAPQGGAGEQVDFASFVISLATTGMVHLGEIPDPATGTPTVSLEGARQMIDILDILKEKTKGNLSAEESHLLENLLYELRMKFLGKSKAIEL